MVQEACNQVGSRLACRVECIRADKIASSGVIQSEIWHEIQMADVVVADVTGLNGNVMIELGVASACRKKEHVIILKEEKPNEHFLFDISPARHIIYKRTFGGSQEVLQKLSNAILMALTSAPFEVTPKVSSIPPLKVDFSEGKDIDWLVGPSVTHRKLTPEYLEFGSLFVFRNSWLNVAGLEISKFELNVEMKFSRLRDVAGWIGVSVRNQHFFANYGHLLYLASNGEVVRTVPENEFGQYYGETIGSFENFDPMQSKFYQFRIEADDHIISMFVDNIGKSFKIAEMPYVYPSGKILFQTYNARVGIKRVEIKQK
jgi:hypothetical protein